MLRHSNQRKSLVPGLRDIPDCCRSKWNSGKKWFQSCLFLSFLCFLALITLIYDHKLHFDLVHLLLRQVKKANVSRPDFHKNNSGWALFVIFNIFIIANSMLFFQIITLPHGKVRVLRSNINKWNVSYWFNTNLVDACFKQCGKSYDIFQEVGFIKNVSRTQYLILMLRFLERKAFYTGL